MVWMYVVTLVGITFPILSMAEMASMAPTSGGQYHWVSEFAPRSAQKFLSYITGWYVLSQPCLCDIQGLNFCLWQQALCTGMAGQYRERVVSGRSANPRHDLAQR